MTEVLTYEALKAKCDALAVENAALKSKAAELVHEASEAYSAYNATIKEPDGDFMDMQTLYEMQCIETPTTDAALAAIQAQGVEKLADKLDAEIEQIMRGAFFYDEISSREAISKMVREFATELREAK